MGTKAKPLARAMPLAALLSELRPFVLAVTSQKTEMQSDPLCV
jgi:hypothetical protein